MPNSNERGRVRADLSPTFKKLSAAEVAGVSRVSSLETTDDQFGQVFKANPAAALAAKGIHISDVQADKLKHTVAELGGVNRGSQEAVNVEVTVGVGVRF